MEVDGGGGRAGDGGVGWMEEEEEEGATHIRYIMVTTQAAWLELGGGREERGFVFGGSLCTPGGRH